MQNTKLREEHKMIELYERHVDMVYRICFSYLKSTMDTEDMVQNTFIRLLDRPVEFENEAHEKAWLIVTARNLCRNHLKSWWQKNSNLEEEMYHLSMEEEADQNLLEMVMKLPEKYRVTLYLYYYEGYDSAEIAKLMEKPSSTVRNYLQRGRDRLKVMLGEDIFEKQ